MDALQEKKFQKHVAAEFIGTLLFTFLAGAGMVCWHDVPGQAARAERIHTQL